MAYDGFNGQVFNWENRLGVPDPLDKKYRGFLGAIKYRADLASFNYLATVFNLSVVNESNPLYFLHHHPDYMGNVDFFLTQCDGMANQYVTDMEDLYETFGFPPMTQALLYSYVSEPDNLEAYSELTDAQQAELVMRMGLESWSEFLEVMAYEVPLIDQMSSAFVSNNQPILLTANGFSGSNVKKTEKEDINLDVIESNVRYAMQQINNDPQIGISDFPDRANFASPMGMLTFAGNNSFTSPFEATAGNAFKTF